MKLRLGKLLGFLGSTPEEPCGAESETERVRRPKGTGEAKLLSHQFPSASMCAQTCRKKGRVGAPRQVDRWVWTAGLLDHSLALEQDLEALLERSLSCV